MKNSLQKLSTTGTLSYEQSKVFLESAFCNSQIPILSIITVHGLKFMVQIIFTIFKLYPKLNLFLQKVKPAIDMVKQY